MGSSSIAQTINILLCYRNKSKTILKEIFSYHETSILSLPEIEQFAGYCRKVGELKAKKCSVAT